MLTFEDAASTAKSAPVTVGSLRVLIEAKKASQDLGQVNPFATLESVAEGYLQKLAGRDDAEVLEMEVARTDPMRIQGISADGQEILLRSGPRMRNSPDYVLAISILRDFG